MLPWKLPSKMLVLVMPVVLLVLLSFVHTGLIQADAGQEVFATPDEAREQLIKAVNSKDFTSLKRIFGPAYEDLDPGDPVQQAAELEHFANHLKEGTEWVKEGSDKAILRIGSAKWPLPVPLVHKDSGWIFDTAAGREEILNRRIGRNELLAINACLSYVEAQKEYYTRPEPEGDQIPKYAQRMISSPGKHDGLYWPTVPGAKESPLGPAIAKAKEQGYLKDRAKTDKGPRPFNGYFFKILKRQGPSAPGGSFSYVINGNMVAGHALIAYPARWGVSGIMTFIVNQRGRVYQKNLGANTSKIARSITSYNPDQTWKLVEEQ